LSKRKTKPAVDVSEQEMIDMLQIDEEPTIDHDPEVERLPAKLGRPSAYRDEFADQAHKLCLLGATDANLADFFGVSVRTVQNWVVQHPDFLRATKAGKEILDSQIERSLYMRARGYEYDDVDIRVVDKELVITPIRKHVPPDTGAICFWLKNRQPERWRDIKAVELSGSGGGAIIIRASKDDLEEG
jgi:hypothetical protein